MKKLLIITIALSMILSLAACGDNGTVSIDVSSAASAGESEVASSVGMPNPWVETDAATIEENIGVTFFDVEGASDVSYQYMESDKLAQMHLTVDGVEWTARIKPTNDYDDISGMEFEWETDTEAPALTVDDYDVQGSPRPR